LFSKKIYDFLNFEKKESFTNHWWLIDLHFDVVDYNADGY